MEVETEKPIHEKIIAIQNQLRIAIQNHHMLVLRKKNFPMLHNDNELNNHMTVIQYLIVNMGRSQAELMARFRQEVASKYDVKPNSLVVSTIMKKFLSFPESPKNIPVYKSTLKSNNDENKKVSSWKPKAMKSLLRVNNNDSNSEKNKYISIGNQKVNATDVTVDGSKIKIVCKGKKESQNSVLVQQPKKLQSVLKSKNVKVNNNEKNETAEEGRNSPESSSSNSGSDSKSKICSSRSNSPIEESDTSEFIPPRRMITRYGRKYEAKMLGKTKIKILCENQNNGIRKESVETINRRDWKSTLLATRAVKPGNREPVSIDELDKEVFLGFFGLISKEKCDALKRKRCERKRRSVAGQSSLYSDYFQPLPKRTYTPRSKPPVPVINNNAVIVESPAIDDDEDEKPTKSESCIICHEEGVLEVCNSCSEMYHFRCLPISNKGFCPSCMAQTTNIPSIVGANNSAGNASSLELIKRYSNDDSIDEANKNEQKANETIH